MAAQDLFSSDRPIWCPNCNGYGSSLHEDTERCSLCGGSGVLIKPESEPKPVPPKP